MSEVVVAAIQFEPSILAVEKNLSIARQMTYEAAAKGAKVIVLPELCTSGYVLRSVAEASSCAQHKNGYQTIAMHESISQFDVTVVFGYPEISEGKLYNSAAVVSSRRGLVGNIRKHNLFGSDNLWAQPSDDLHNVVITPECRLGVLICRDAMNKYRESYRFSSNDVKFYSRGSVDTIALLTNWGTGYGYPDSSWVELVEQTGSNVIVSNRVGKERDMKFKGGSCVIDRQRRVWTNGSSFTEAAVVGGVII